MLTVVVLVLILLGYLCLVGLLSGNRNKHKDDGFGAGYIAGSSFHDSNEDRFF